MVFDMRKHSAMIKDSNIHIMYSGPMWYDGIKGISEMVRTQLEGDHLPGSAAKAVFSVFVEQVTNMLMYSAEKEHFKMPDNSHVDVSTGMLALGVKNKTHFIQTGNAVRTEDANFIKDRIDHLNKLDKKEIRQFYKEKLREDNDNPGSKGAGLGLIEIAKRATAPIDYTIEQFNESISYFTMYVEITQEGI